MNYRYAFWMPALFIMALAFLVHFNTIFNDYAWDDLMVFSQNPEVREPLVSAFSKADNIRGLDYTPYYRPLTMLSFMAEQRLHNLNPAFMHLLNTLLHCTNAALVYFLARTLTPNKWIPLVASSLFAVHPIATESVAFLAGGRNTLLATLCALSAYLLHHSAASLGRFSYTLPAACCLLAGLFSKELALGIIPFIIYLEIAHLKNNADALKRAIARLVTYLVPLTIYIWLRSSALSDMGESDPIFPGLLSRLANNIYTLPRYLLTLVWPPASSMNYVLPETLTTYLIPLLITWIGILCAMWWLTIRDKSPISLFGLAWFITFWLPTGGILPFPSAAMADRYLYLPVFGLWLVVADQGVRIFERSSQLRRYIPALSLVVLVLLGAASTIRERVWKNDITLFSDYVRQYPDQAIGHHNLGTAYLDLLNDLEHAEQEFLTTLQINPRFPRTHTQLGYIRLLRGDYAGALAHYEAALMIDPYDAEAVLNRGTVLDRMGRYGEAYMAYKLFLEIPDRIMSKSRENTEIRIRELEQIMAGRP